MNELKQIFTEPQNLSINEKQVSLDNEKEIEAEKLNEPEHLELESHKHQPIITPRTSKVDYSSYDNALRSDMCLRNFLKNV